MTVYVDLGTQGTVALDLGNTLPVIKVIAHMISDSFRNKFNLPLVWVFKY